MRRVIIWILKESKMNESLYKETKMRNSGQLLQDIRDADGLLVSGLQVKADGSVKGQILTPLANSTPIHFHQDPEINALRIVSVWGPADHNIVDVLLKQLPESVPGRFQLKDKTLQYLTSVRMQDEDIFKFLLATEISAHRKVLKLLFPEFRKLAARTCQQTPKQSSKQQNSRPRKGKPKKSKKRRYRWRLLCRPLRDPSGNIILR